MYCLFMKDDGTFPNNEWYPLILFKNAFHGSQGKGEHLITEGGWMSPWVWGIFPYHHYHSTAWELLLCVKGHAHMQLGGESGPKVPLDNKQCGDVLSFHER